MMPTLTQRLTAFQAEVATKNSKQDEQIAYFAEIVKAILTGEWQWAEALTKALRGGPDNPDNDTWSAVPFEDPGQQ
jgi:hypothetical protein